ncbi:MAG: murein biosynthesis integral membrane protein MurJ, partial [Myxococcota bacterium]
PNALRVLLGEGAASAAFVPVFSEVREKRGAEASARFLQNILGALLVVLAVVTALGILLAEPLVMLYTDRLDEDRLLQTVDLTRVTFPYIFFMGLAALGAGALHAHGRFWAPSFAPTLLNFSLIGAAFWLEPFAKSWGLPAVGALAIGAIVGGLLQVVALAPSLRSVLLLRVPRFDVRDLYVQKSFALLIPLLAGLGVHQLNVLLSRRFASSLAAGSVSYLYYGQRLVELPQGMFAMAISMAALPTLSRLRSRGSDEAVRAVFMESLSMVLFVSIPASFALFTLAEPTVDVLLRRGEFGTHAALETAKSLKVMSLGVWATASARTIVPLFHAYNDTRSPVVAAFVNLVVFVAAALLLMEHQGHVGIAVALTLASGAQLLAYIFLLGRRNGSIPLRPLGAKVGRMVLASVAMTTLVLGLQEAFERLLHWSANSVLSWTACVSVGMIGYLFFAGLLRCEELNTLRRIVGRHRT